MVEVRTVFKLATEKEVSISEHRVPQMKLRNHKAL